MQKAKAKMDYEKIWCKVKSAMSCKVDKIHGKGLSTHDYTSEDKEKVDNISFISIAEIDKLFSERR